MKLYIAVLETVPHNMVPVLVAHAVLTAHEKFRGQLAYDEWFKNSYKKCVISVNQKEYSRIIECGLMFSESHENKTLGGMKSCVVTMPHYDSDRPNVLKYAKLWKPTFNRQE